MSHVPADRLFFLHSPVNDGPESRDPDVDGAGCRYVPYHRPHPFVHDRTLESHDAGRPDIVAEERPAAQEEFFRALHAYKQMKGREFPTWNEVLEVLRELGHHAVDNPTFPLNQ
jgi:hypothetical protein